MHREPQSNGSAPTGGDALAPRSARISRLSRPRSSRTRTLRYDSSVRARARRRLRDGERQSSSHRSACSSGKSRHAVPRLRRAPHGGLRRERRLQSRADAGHRGSYRGATNACDMRGRSEIEERAEGRVRPRGGSARVGDAALHGHAALRSRRSRTPRGRPKPTRLYVRPLRPVAALRRGSRSVLRGAPNARRRFAGLGRLGADAEQALAQRAAVAQPHAVLCGRALSRTRAAEQHEKTEPSHAGSVPRSAPRRRTRFGTGCVAVLAFPTTCPGAERRGVHAHRSFEGGVPWRSQPKSALRMDSEPRSKPLAGKRTASSSSLAA